MLSLSNELGIMLDHVNFTEIIYILSDERKITIITKHFCFINLQVWKIYKNKPTASLNLGHNFWSLHKHLSCLKYISKLKVP